MLWNEIAGTLLHVTKGQKMAANIWITPMWMASLFLCTDMQKFPLRMKDNDLLITELFRDPASEVVTALSVYLTPKTSKYSKYSKPLKMVSSYKRPQFIFEIIFFAKSSLLIWPTYSDLSRSNFFDNLWPLRTLLSKRKKLCRDGWNMENRWPLEISNQSAFNNILLWHNVTIMAQPVMIHEDPLYWPYNVLAL